MHFRKNIFNIIGLICICLLIISCDQKQDKNEHNDQNLNVLIFSKANGYRHESIEPGTKVMEAYFKIHGINSMHSEDSSMFTFEKLKPFDAIIFFQTTGIILDSIQRIAFQKFIQSGKGFVGIHSAADTEYDWPWFTELLGVQFADHPDIQTATVVKNDTSFIACKHLPDRWTRTDEWYNYKKLPVNVRVLLSVDEATYQGGVHGANHPVSWCHEYDGGRSFYTAMGHTVENYQDTLFLEHIMKGVQWVSGRFD